MSAIPDRVLEGSLCQMCEVPIPGEPPGFPRNCKACDDDPDDSEIFLRERILQ